MTGLSEVASSADSHPAGKAVTSVRIDTIIVRDRLRRLLPDRVAAMASSIQEARQHTPVDLVETPAGLRLIKGAIRIAALQQLGSTAVDAIIHPAGAFGSELDIRLQEIATTFVRFDLNALERAVYIAEWRSIYEQKFPPKKRGRKPKRADDTALEELSAEFALNFTDAAQRSLGLSRRAIFLDLKIAGMPAAIRDAIAELPLAANQRELLELADVPQGQQPAIVELLRGGAQSVGDAIATIEQKPLPSRAAPHQRLSESFSRLKEDEQWRFFDLHADRIAIWRAERGV